MVLFRPSDRDDKTLVKTHRVIQQWDHWLTQPLGMRLLEAEENFLPPLLTDCYGKHALLVGVPNQRRLLKFSAIPHQVLLSPMLHRNNTVQYIEGEFYELPIAPASIDLVVMPHTLEFIDNPRQLLSEACRIVKPEGYIIIFGFNPYSLWGLKKWLKGHSAVPWSGNSLPATQVKKWLRFADFELVKHDTFLFRPPLEHHDGLYQQLKMMEWLGSKGWRPFGGVYILMAKAKVIPLTPIKLHWKQQPSSINITIPKPTIRNWQ